MVWVAVSVFVTVVGAVVVTVVVSVTVSLTVTVGGAAGGVRRTRSSPKSLGRDIDGVSPRTGGVHAQLRWAATTINAAAVAVRRGRLSGVISQPPSGLGAGLRVNRGRPVHAVRLGHRWSGDGRGDC